MLDKHEGFKMFQHDSVRLGLIVSGEIPKDYLCTSVVLPNRNIHAIMEVLFKKDLGGLWMDNNDILIRLRYALDLRDTDMVKIFKLGGAELTLEQVRKLLIKSKETYRYNDEGDDHDEIEEKDENIKCKNSTLEAFLNGFIILKRGKQDPKPGQPELPGLKKSENPNNINNMMLKKLKIALSLTSDDVLDILEKAGVIVTKGELSAFLRKEGHNNYKECGDKYARNFLKGLALKNRG